MSKTNVSTKESTYLIEHSSVGCVYFCVFPAEAQGCELAILLTFFKLTHLFALTLKTTTYAPPAAISGHRVSFHPDHSSILRQVAFIF